MQLPIPLGNLLYFHVESCLQYSAIPICITCLYSVEFDFCTLSSIYLSPCFIFILIISFVLLWNLISVSWISLMVSVHVTLHVLLLVWHGCYIAFSFFHLHDMFINFFSIISSCILSLSRSLFLKSLKWYCPLHRYILLLYNLVI